MARKKKKSPSKKKKDWLKWPRVVTPILFGLYLLTFFFWIDRHSETNWLTYFLTESGFLPGLAFCLLMAIVSVRRFRFTLIWLGLLGLEVLVGGHPSFGSRPDIAADKTVRVMTYNVAHFDLDRPGVIEDMRQADADLIFIQEACKPEEQKAVGEMLCKELKGYQFVSASSNMILSRLPIKFEKFLNVPTKWPVKQFPIATVQSPLGPIRVISVHMEPSWVEKMPPDFGEYIPVVSKVVRDRQAQVDLLMASLRPSKIPVIMAGDFNGTPGSESIRRLSDYFTDSYATTERGFGMSLLAKLPYKRIDYVWTRGLTPLQTEVVKSMASDHMPVVAVIGK